MKRIVVVDNNHIMHDVWDAIFDRQDYEVSIYENAGLILTRKLPTPDIFVIHRSLSCIDGLDLCRFIKSWDVMKNVPVIIYSAYPGIIHHAREAGADAAIEKPFSIKAIRQLISRYL